jgi:VanZ family protein
MHDVAPALRRYLRWLPALGWAGMIFVFSTEAFSGGNTKGILEPLLRGLFPALSGTGIELIHLCIRKLGHFVEYFVLAVLVLRAARDKAEEPLPSSRLAVGLALTALYAVSDEWHQAFVPSRSASSADVLLDVFGGFCGMLWFHLRNRGKNPL